MRFAKVVTVNKRLTISALLLTTTTHTQRSQVYAINCSHMLHGTQPKGSEADALKLLKKNGVQHSTVERYNGVIYVCLLLGSILISMVTVQLRLPNMKSLVLFSYKQPLEGSKFRWGVLKNDATPTSSRLVGKLSRAYRKYDPASNGRDLTRCKPVT